MKDEVNTLDTYCTPELLPTFPISLFSLHFLIILVAKAHKKKELRAAHLTCPHTDYSDLLNDEVHLIP